MAMTDDHIKLMMLMNPPSPALVREWDPRNAGFQGWVGETCYRRDGRQAVVTSNDSNGRRPVTACALSTLPPAQPKP